MSTEPEKPMFNCELCSDTGWIGSEPCECDFPNEKILGEPRAERTKDTEGQMKFPVVCTNCWRVQQDTGSCSYCHVHQLQPVIMDKRAAVSDEPEQAEQSSGEKCPKCKGSGLKRGAIPCEMCKGMGLSLRQGTKLTLRLKQAISPGVLQLMARQLEDCRCAGSVGSKVNSELAKKLRKLSSAPSVERQPKSEKWLDELLEEIERVARVAAEQFAASNHAGQYDQFRTIEHNTQTARKVLASLSWQPKPEGGKWRLEYDEVSRHPVVNCGNKQRFIFRTAACIEQALHGVVAAHNATLSGRSEGKTDLEEKEP